VDGWHQVVALADHWKTSWFLQPRLLKVRIENCLALAIEHSCRNDIGLYVIAFEIQNKVFSLSDGSVLFCALTHAIVSFSKRHMQHLFVCSASDFRFGFFVRILRLDNADSQLGVNFVVVFFKL
jgi:hypothetical protein